MRKYTFILLFLGFGLVTGCASVKSEYWRERGRDLRDIVTVAVGAGVGAKAIAGPLHCGLFGNMDLWGIRTGVSVGEVERFENDNFLLPIGPLAPAILRNPPIFGFDYTSCRTCKHVVMAHTFPFFSMPEPHYLEGRPMWAGGSGPFYSPMLFHKDEHALQYLTEFELAAGLGLTVRLGLNPGEMVDFVAGFFGGDLYGDDEKDPYVENIDKNIIQDIRNEKSETDH